MNIQLKEWKIIKINYTLFKKNQKREGNYFDLDFKREFYKNHRSFAIRFYTHIEDENFDLEEKAGKIFILSIQNDFSIKVLFTPFSILKT